MKNWLSRHAQILILTAMLLGWAVVAAAQEPVPNEPGVFTFRKDYQPASLKFRLRNVAEYKKQTHDPAAVQADAEAFLTAYAHHVTGQPKALDWPAIAKMGDQLAARGSTDPLVALHRALVMAAVQRKAEARKLFDSATPELSAAGYSPRFAMYAQQWRYRLLPAFEFPQEQRPHAQTAIDAMIAAGSMPVEKPLDRWFLWANISTFQNEMRLADQKALMEASGPRSKVDPWIGHMIAGHYFVNRAWAELGAAKESRALSEAELKPFAETLRLAQPHLVAAWKAFPEIPTAATEMILVAWAGADPHPPRYWFDQAVAGQMDYAPAYTALLDALRPWRGGSMGQMYRFGLECLKTERFDTDVPYVYLQAMISINADLANQNAHPEEVGEAWRRPGVYAHAVQLFEGLQKQRAREGNVDKADELHQKSVHAAVAIFAQEYGDARRLFDELGDGVARQPFENFRVPLGLELSRSRVYALTSAGGKEVAQIEEVLRNGKKVASKTTDRAIELLAVARQKDASANSKAYLEHLDTALQNIRSASSGSWINLTFNKDLATWNKDSKDTWVVENEKTVVGAPTAGLEEEMGLSKIQKFSPPFEMEVIVEPVKNAVGKTEPEFGGIKVFGNLKPLPDGRQYIPRYIFYVDAVRGIAGTVDDNNAMTHKHVAVNSSNRVRVKVWKGCYQVYVNDALLETVKNPTFDPWERQGIGGSYTKGRPGKTRFSNVRIRPLTYEPPPEASDAKACIAYYSKLIQADAADGQPYFQRGKAYIAEKQFEPASKDFETAIKHGIGVDAAPAHDYLAYSYEVLHAYDKALPQYEAALKAAREARMPLTSYLHNYSWFLATCPDDKSRNGAKAVELAMESCRATKFGDWMELKTLAAAYAEAGKFKDAVVWAKKCRDLAPPKEKSKMQARVIQYQANKPFRDTAE